MVFSLSISLSSEITVKYFSKFETDLTAKVFASKKDQNGDDCAIIKVVTTQKGFTWDPDALGIVSVVPKSGEYWLYIPFGAKRLTISHPDFGILRNYQYPLPIERSAVYEMVLQTEKIVIPGENKRDATQFVVFKTDPEEGVEVLLNNKSVGLTPLQLELLEEEYIYSLKKDGFQTVEGSFKLIESEGKKEINIPMKRKEVSAGSLKIVSNIIGASIFLNGKSYGTTPSIIKNLPANNYDLTLLYKNYACGRQKIRINDEERTEINVTMVNKRNVTFKSDTTGLELKINGISKGAMPCTFEMLFGTYTVEIEQFINTQSTIFANVSDTIIQYHYPRFNTYTNQVSDKLVQNVNNELSFRMSPIEGGTFLMGSKNGLMDEMPVHAVTVKNFYLGQTEVTQKLWKTVMRTNPSYFKNDSLPVENVSFNQIQTFLSALNEISKRNYRLPTEKEWEYAAGGGSSNRTIWAGTSDTKWVDFFIFSKINSDKTTHPVANKYPNFFGLYDMGGNVSEWCNDYYIRYDNTETEIEDVGRVFRGGSWADLLRNCTVSNREYHLPSYSSKTIGFRLALDD